MAITAGKREIIDMAGRRVMIPDKIRTVYAPSPYGFTMLCSVAPDRLPGLLQPLQNEELRFLPSCLHHLPVIGMLPSIDLIAAARPDVVIVWAEKKKPFHRKSEEALNNLNIPFVYVIIDDLVDLRDYPAAYSFVGRLLDCETAVAPKVEYCRQTLSETETVLKQIPSEKRPGVYYAQGRDGLATEFDDSLHAHLLKLAGDVNVHRGQIQTHAGMEKVSIEQVAAAAPDIILALDKAFFADVFRNPAWKQVEAVRNHRVHLIPSLPFNWFDRPPSFMRFLGLKWLMQLLYPDFYQDNMIEETRTFFALFLDVTISAADAAELLGLSDRHSTTGLKPPHYPASLKPAPRKA